ncbi:response regulator transcription factor [Plectonema cf. radiosum LEGE 06105]|uniref:Response regulator transcription factor n=1 Tax=Plectonema cf. radiosum LEGE 06105 TaxID=945769 RepID=A0A8J7F581_9CYAN|nr:response regulator transcription factor [Plectonema radiosum]MBE9216073.1 response regulator transcription factor [Plectonema cf. radiosum LEGE 06105]
MNQRQISVLLVDDQEPFRQGLCNLLNFYKNSNSLAIEVIGEANCVEQALKLTTQKLPSLILLDMELVGSDGITALARLKDMNYSGKVLVLSAHQEDDYIFQAMEKGAAGYLFKTSVANQLYEAINTVMESKIYLPPEATSSFFRRFQANSDSMQQKKHQLRLTQREQEVLSLLAQGASNEVIAKKLYVTIATVKAHLTSIFEKLEVTSRTQAVVAAIKLGLVQAE